MYQQPRQRKLHDIWRKVFKLDISEVNHSRAPSRYAAVNSWYSLFKHSISQGNENSTLFGGCFSNWISLRVNHRRAPTHSAAVGRSGIDGTLTENRSPACEVSYRVLVLNNNGVLDSESLKRRTTQILALYTVTRQEEIGTCRLPNL